MEYKLVRKANQRSSNEKYIANAIQERCLGYIYITTLSLKYTIQYATLYRPVKSGSAEERLGQFRTAFNNKQEKQLFGYVQFMDSLFYGLTRKEFKKLAYDFVEKNKVPQPSQNGAAEDVWLMGFICRHPSISLLS
jgi:hypothetical protein